MEVSCPACSARYSADDEKLRGKTARMRCRACETVWLVSGPSTDDVAAESKRAAVVRKGADREKRDLFASRPNEEHGSVKQTLFPPPMGELTAARNENSVLFKVENLAGAPSSSSAGSLRMKTPAEPAPISHNYAASASPISTRPSDDDEGVIDLKALSSLPPRPAANPVQPLFASEPPTGFARDAGASSSSLAPAAPGPLGKFNKRLIGGIGAGVGAFAVCIIAVVVLFGGSDPKPAAAAANANIATPPPPAATTAAAPKPAEPPPQAAAAAAPAEDKADEPAGHGKGKGKGKGKKGAAHTPIAGKSDTGGGTVTMSKYTPPKPPPPPVKAADPCHCKGDFNCILRCTATGK